MALSLPTQAVSVLNFECVCRPAWIFKCKFIRLDELQLELTELRHFLSSDYIKFYDITVNNLKDEYLLRIDSEKKDDHLIAVGLQLNFYHNFAETIGPVQSLVGRGLLTAKVHGNNLGIWLQELPSARQVLDVFIAGFLALCLVKQDLGFNHNDIHMDNIMVSKTSTIQHYQLYDYDITIAAEYKPIFIDFEYSTTSKHPSESDLHASLDLFHYISVFYSITESYVELNLYFARLLNYFVEPIQLPNRTCYTGFLPELDYQLSVKQVLDYVLLDHEKWL